LIPRMIKKSTGRFIVVVADQAIPSGFEIMVTNDASFWTSGIVALRNSTEIKLPDHVADSYISIEIYNHYGKRLVPTHQLFIPPLEENVLSKIKVPVNGVNTNFTPAITIFSLFFCVVLYQWIRPETQVKENKVQELLGKPIVTDSTKPPKISWPPVPTNKAAPTVRVASSEDTIAQGTNLAISVKKSSRPVVNVIQNCGEYPPEAVPSTNKPIPKIGDTYTYQTNDHITPENSKVIVREIIAIDENEIKFKVVNQNKGKYTRIMILDRQLGIKVNEGSTFFPALKYYNFPLSVNQNWRSISKETREGKSDRTNQVSGQVIGMEQIKVAAGTFQTWKIQLAIIMIEGDTVEHVSDTTWYAPSVRRTVKSEIKTSDALGGIKSNRTIELISCLLR
jgi:hypothetical protein